MKMNVPAPDAEKVMENADATAPEEKTGTVLPPPDARRLLGALGLAARAGKLVWGTQNVCDALKAGRVRLVVEAEGNSANTHKRLTDRCAYYKVRLIPAPFGADVLGSAIGRGNDVSSAAVTDANFAVLIAGAVPADK